MAGARQVSKLLFPASHKETAENSGEVTLVRRPKKSGKTFPGRKSWISAPPKRSAQAVPSANAGRLASVMRKIESGLPQSVRQLAQEVKMTPDHLQRLFKQETGLRLGSVIAERKLGAAAHLLSATDVVIKEVAYTVGYSHPSSFVRAFRRRFGKSPTEYRQRAA
jgi:AraC-like DNA-binding protein